MGERWGLGENVGLLLYDVGVYEAGDDLIFLGYGCGFWVGVG
jgi:hypothetical protein